MIFLILLLLLSNNKTNSSNDFCKWLLFLLALLFICNSNAYYIDPNINNNSQEPLYDLMPKLKSSFNIHSPEYNVHNINRATHFPSNINSPITIAPIHSIKPQYTVKKKINANVNTSINEESNFKCLSEEIGKNDNFDFNITKETRDSPSLVGVSDSHQLKIGFSAHEKAIQNIPININNKSINRKPIKPLLKLNYCKNSKITSNNSLNNINNKKESFIDNNSNDTINKKEAFVDNSLNKIINKKESFIDNNSNNTINKKESARANCLNNANNKRKSFIDNSLNSKKEINTNYFNSKTKDTKPSNINCKNPTYENNVPHKSNDIIPHIIQNNYRGARISILLSGFGVITGEVIFNFNNITTLKLKNNITVFINNNYITSFF